MRDRIAHDVWFAPVRRSRVPLVFTLALALAGAALVLSR